MNAPVRRTRRWRRWRLPLALLACVGCAIAVWGCAIEPARLVERDYALVLPHWPARCDGLRVDVIADTHTGSPRNGLDHLDRVVDRLLTSDADAVLMAGDYVILSVFMGSYVPIEDIAPHLRRLTARKRVYAVLGNHDWWKDGPRIQQALEGAGVVVLQNRATAVRVRDCRFWIAGIGDLLEGRPDIDGTLAQVPAGAPTLALTHEPDLFARMPARVALTIAGHTHGGQIALGPLRPTRFVLGSNFLAGPLADGERRLFVSSGIGTSIVPMRLGRPPEISRLTLRTAAVSP
jgi:predicted MPP superfamily phosphohydrolase